MASEERMGQAPMRESNMKVMRAGARAYVVAPARKMISRLRGEAAVERKASKMEAKSKKASARLAESPTLRAANGDVVATAPARAKTVFPGRLGPPNRRRVLNTIVRSAFKCATASTHQEDMKVVDDVLSDLPRATRSEPTAAILPALEDEWM